MTPFLRGGIFRRCRHFGLRQFFWGKPNDHHRAMILLGDIVLLEKSLKTKTYPCGGHMLYIDVPSAGVAPGEGWGL